MNDVVLPESARTLVAQLGLKPLDLEGGYFRRTAEASLWVKALEGGGEACRAYSLIYALFTPESFSALHLLGKDEIWCWHGGDPLESLRLYPDGQGEWVKLGLDVAAGQRPQDIILAGVWQGTRLAAGGTWALVSCVVAPEFRWSDFTLADRAELSARYPQFAEGIADLTRDVPLEGNR